MGELVPTLQKRTGWLNFSKPCPCCRTEKVQPFAKLRDTELVG